MEAALKVFVYVGVGLLLLALNTWYVTRVKEAIGRSEMPRVIAPFQIVGKSDDGDKLGKVLAYMLRARLGKIREEMASSYKSLEDARDLRDIKPAINPIVPAQKPIASDVDSGPVLPDAVFEPLNLNMTVSGVEVGGILSWLHRWLTEDEALVVSVSYNGDKAIASGNISTTGASILWVDTTGKDDVEMIADVAYAITQKRFAERYNEVEALTPKEFRILLTSLHTAAKLNRQAAFGRASGPPYKELFTQLNELAKQVPKWHLLIRLTATTAERAQLSVEALAYYEQELSLIRDTPARDDRTFLEAKVKELKGLIEEKNAAAVALASDDPEEKVNETVIGKIRSLVGVSSVNMSGTTTVAILGPAPPKNIVPPNQMSVIAPQTQVNTKPDPDLAEYTSTIVQAVQLVAPKTQFMFVPITLGTDVNAFRTELTGALNRILNLDTKPHVLLAPYSGLEAAELGPLFQQLSSQGVTIVISAGNNPSKPIPFANSSFLNQLMVVSAVDLDGRKLEFAPSDQSVLWAPGDRIPLLVNGRVELRAGTGYSAAIAAGVAARVLEQRKELSPTQLIELLRTSAQKRTTDGPAIISFANATNNVNEGASR